MAIFTIYGLGQEGGVLFNLCTTDSTVLAPRGITPAFLTSYNTAITTMTQSSSDATLAKENTGVLTGQEHDLDAKVMKDIGAITDIVKITYPGGGAIWKAFRIGDIPGRSTKKILERANDCLKAAKEHKTDLLAKGLLQSDIDTLESDIPLLTSTDASQETSKRSDSPKATAAQRKAAKDVKTMSDQIHAVASAAFKGDPEKLKPYKAAKKLRYLPPPRKPKNPPTDNKSGGTTPPAK